MKRNKRTKKKPPLKSTPPSPKKCTKKKVAEVEAPLIHRHRRMFCLIQKINMGQNTQPKRRPMMFMILM